MKKRTLQILTVAGFIGYLLAMLLGVLPAAAFTILVLNPFKCFFVYLHFYRLNMKEASITSLSNAH